MKLTGEGKCMTSTCVAFYLILIMVRHDYYMILLGYCIAGIFCQSLISFYLFSFLVEQIFSKQKRRSLNATCTKRMKLYYYYTSI